MSRLRIAATLAILLLGLLGLAAAALGGLTAIGMLNDLRPRMAIPYQGVGAREATAKAILMWNTVRVGAVPVGAASFLAVLSSIGLFVAGKRRAFPVVLVASGLVSLVVPAGAFGAWYAHRVASLAAQEEKLLQETPESERVLYCIADADLQFRDGVGFEWSSASALSYDTPGRACLGRMERSGMIKKVAAGEECVFEYGGQCTVKNTVTRWVPVSPGAVLRTRYVAAPKIPQADPGFSCFTIKSLRLLDLGGNEGPFADIDEDATDQHADVTYSALAGAALVDTCKSGFTVYTGTGATMNAVAAGGHQTVTLRGGHMDLGKSYGSVRPVNVRGYDPGSSGGTAAVEAVPTPRATGGSRTAPLPTVTEPAGAASGDVGRPSAAAAQGQDGSADRAGRARMEPADVPVPASGWPLGPAVIRVPSGSATGTVRAVGRFGAQVVAELDPGTPVSIVATSRDKIWSQIRWTSDDGAPREGWIHRDVLRPPRDPSGATAAPASP